MADLDLFKLVAAKYSLYARLMLAHERAPMDDELLARLQADPMIPLAERLAEWWEMRPRRR